MVLSSFCVLINLFVCVLLYELHNKINNNATQTYKGQNMTIFQPTGTKNCLRMNNRVIQNTKSETVTYSGDLCYICCPNLMRVRQKLKENLVGVCFKPTAADAVDLHM